MTREHAPLVVVLQRSRRGARLPATLIAFVASVLASASAQPPPFTWRTVAFGVEHTRLLRVADETGAAAGPWNINALRIDLNAARLDVVHAMDEAVGLETVTSMAERRRAIAAVNGGYFRTSGTFRGDSTGTLVVDRVLLSEPDRGRSAVGFARDGRTTRLIFGHVAWEGALSAAGRMQTLHGLNRPRGANELVLFTPAFHRTTLTDGTGTEAVVRSGKVTEIVDGGSTLIPADGVVISATGSMRPWVRELLPLGTAVSISMQLTPADPGVNPWTSAEDIVGAGPKLVSGGRVDITFEREHMLATFSTERHPRTAIARLRDGRALLVVVDGRQPLLSIGVSLEELARLLIELGAEEAINLDGGGSSAMVVEGKLVNRPSDSAGERPVSDAILVTAAR